jgi:hypothetical protein
MRTPCYRLPFFGGESLTFVSRKRQILHVEGKKNLLFQSVLKSGWHNIVVGNIHVYKYCSILN